MAKYANVLYKNTRIEKPGAGVSNPVDNPDTHDDPQQLGLTGYRRYTDIYIELRDEFNQPVDGNYATVNYREDFNGELTEIKQIIIPGSIILFQNDVLKEYTDVDNYYYYDLKIIGDVIENNGSYTPPGVCDAKIQTVLIDKRESSSGSNDAQVTISATSNSGEIKYSLDNATWQLSPVFSGLHGGNYTAYIKDGYGCTEQKIFTVDTISNLLVNDPSANTGSGNISRWNAAFNPVVFTYQRRDFGITNIYASGAQTVFTINGALSISGPAGSAQVAPNDIVYIKAGAYDDVYQVKEVNLVTSSITIDGPYTYSASNTGFININKLRPYYQVCTKIGYQDKITGQQKTISSTHRPDNKGIVKADISNFLQSLLRAKDDSDFTEVNYRDDNLSASYTVSYAEVWYNVTTGEDTQPVYINIQAPYYATYSARQLGDSYGGNMAAYVPFKTVDGPSKRASWLTDFAEPAYSPGYPFDIGFIYSEDLAGLNLYAEITPLDINRNPLADGVQTTYLLNENNSFLLQQDSSKLIIYKQPVSNQPVTSGIAERIGLNRLLINHDFGSQVHYFDVEIKYADTEGTIHTVTQAQTIRIDDMVDDQSVYMRWIGLTGSWNYYRFVYNQEVTLDVQNAVIIKNHILDWANQDAMEDVISKSAGIKMKVMAEDLSVADIKGLQSIKYSPKVQMLKSKNPVKWQTVVLNTATFTEYETRNGQAPFSITFNLPALNIQTQ